ncbi:3-deoxy-7-phosphoheptulonate synthase, partial [candidate division KSB1 bacterium]|nr:3-deoxy-7-phosphoheptulonate synthase [candidate division KSB1 bacterium]
MSDKKPILNLVSNGDWLGGGEGPFVIAGPCSAETEEQIMKTGLALRKIPQVRVFRAGIWKPRTRPNSFEGV